MITNERRRQKIAWPVTERLQSYTPFNLHLRRIGRSDDTISWFNRVRTSEAHTVPESLQSKLNHFHSDQIILESLRGVLNEGLRILGTRVEPVSLKEHLCDYHPFLLVFYIVVERTEVGTRILALKLWQKPCCTRRALENLQISLVSSLCTFGSWAVKLERQDYYHVVVWTFQSPSPHSSYLNLLLRVKSSADDEWHQCVDTKNRKRMTASSLFIGLEWRDLNMTFFLKPNIRSPSLVEKWLFLLWWCGVNETPSLFPIVFGVSSLIMSI